MAAPQVPYLRGGAELHTELLVEALRSAGHEVELITLPFVWTGDESSLQQCRRQSGGVIDQHPSPPRLFHLSIRGPGRSDVALRQDHI